MARVVVDPITRIEGHLRIEVQAENGRIALDVLSKVRPNLILLDLMMPEMDGFEFLAALRGIPGTPGPSPSGSAASARWFTPSRRAGQWRMPWASRYLRPGA